MWQYCSCTLFACRIMHCKESYYILQNQVESSTDTHSLSSFRLTQFSNNDDDNNNNNNNNYYYYYLNYTPNISLWEWKHCEVEEYCWMRAVTQSLIGKQIEEAANKGKGLDKDIHCEYILHVWWFSMVCVCVCIYIYIHTHTHMYIVDHIFNSDFQKPNCCSIWSVFLRLAVMFLHIVNLTHAVNESCYSTHYVLHILFSYVFMQ